MKRWGFSLTAMASALLLISAGMAYAQGGHGGAGGGEEDAITQGAALYAEYCQACHGPDGQGAGTGPAFVALHVDPATVHDVIAEGQDSDPADGVAMPGYGEILDDESIEALAAYLEAWEAGDAPPLPAPNLHSAVKNVTGYDGDPEAGAGIYAQFCYGCHGAEGEGRGADPFPAFEVTHNTLYRVRGGTENPYMPAFGADQGGPLDETQLADLRAYMATWHHSSTQDQAQGISFLLMFLGVAAILGVGAAYLSGMIKTES